VEFEINDKSPAPAKVQLADQLRAGIASGEISERLPSLTELTRASGLALNTVQAAVRILKDEGLVYGVKGRGVFVRKG
jgi:DNA-binding transcriptional regulator YhcF (GntR family)